MHMRVIPAMILYGFFCVMVLKVTCAGIASLYSKSQLVLACGEEETQPQEGKVKFSSADEAEIILGETPAAFYNDAIPQPAPNYAPTVPDRHFVTPTPPPWQCIS